MEETRYTVASVGPKIDGFLKAVLQKARLHVSFEIVEGETPHPDFENPDLVVKFSGRDTDLLLENKAEVLLALEHLTMEVLRMPAEHHSRLCFDACDYRVMRVEELRLSALTAADKVKKTRVPFRFNPMTSRERRIIHLALRNETAVRSESTGSGPSRQVMILPADMPMPPEAPAPPMAPALRRGRRR